MKISLKADHCSEETGKKEFKDERREDEFGDDGL